MYVKSSYNNTIVTITDTHGNVLNWSSGGKLGFKGTRKSTPYVAQEVLVSSIKYAIENYKMKKVSVFLKGFGAGKSTAKRFVKSMNVEVLKIQDITPRSFN